MKCFKNCVVLSFICMLTVNAAELQFKEQIRALSEQIEVVKTLHLNDVTRLNVEIEELKRKSAGHSTNNYDQNEQTTLEWATTSMRELRIEIKELGENINNSVLLRQLHVIRNELKQALTETSDLAQMALTQETRVDKLDNEVGRLKYEGQQMKTLVAELRSQVGKLSKEVKTKQMDDLNLSGYNDVIKHRRNREDARPAQAHKIRHNKMVHTQISRLARTQNQLEGYQQNLQSQLLDAQRRLDRLEEPNWNLLSAKVDFLELEAKVLQNELKNVSQKISDFDKVHASMLELREDVESIENKADKTIPEFRKEISKLDINYAQLNAQSSYIREDQENMRQSVKAIAISISNAVDRAEMDRLTMKKINDSIEHLKTSSKQHFYRLNDHILKSEANSDFNVTEVPLSELMGEVKQLQSVEHEYEDLVNQLPKDCSSIAGPPGVYLIHATHAPADTWCANGTTLIQRRYNGTVEFNRPLSEYVVGFGNAASEYWLGLESMHRLTADNCSSMRIDMTDIYNGYWYAQYEHFYVGGSDAGYVLEVSGFKGNASDAFEYQNHMEFSAIDHDRDTSNTHCAGNYEGGWWYSHCQHVNINGKYTLGLTWFDSVRNEWIAVATSEMRMYRRQDCQ